MTLRSVSKILILFLAPLLPSFSVPGLSQTPCSELAPQERQTTPISGIIVEKIEPYSQAQKSGLLEADVVIRWSRGPDQGSIESPFDLLWIEVEQAPLANVTLEGLRSQDKQTWILGANSWGIRSRPDFSATSLANYHRGEKLILDGRPEQAVEFWLSQISQVQPSRHLSWWLFRAGVLLADARRWTEANEFLQKASACLRALQPARLPVLLSAAGDALLQDGNQDLANRYFQQALEESQKLGAEGLLRAKILDNLANVSLRGGDLDKAEARYNQALAIQKALAPNGLPMALTFNGLGYVYDYRGNWDKAREYHQQALAIQQKIAPQSIAITNSFIGLASAAFYLGDLDTADSYFRKALEIRIQLAPGSSEVALNLIGIGNVAWGRGKLREAEESFGHALEIQRKLDPESLGVASSLLSLGNIAGERGDLARAEECYQRALAIRQKLAPESLATAEALNNMGRVAAVRGDDTRAETYLRQSIAIKNKIAPGSFSLAHSLHNLAKIAEDRGNFQQAQDLFLETLKIAEQTAPDSFTLAGIFVDLGALARKRGDLNQAGDYLQRALSLSEKASPAGLDQSQSLLELGNVASDRNDLVQAEQCYRRALAIVEKIAPNSQLHAESLAALADLMVRRQPDAAAALFDQALNALESQTARLGGSEEIRSDFRAKHSHFYKQYIDLLIERGQPQLAFAVAERSRARTLLEMLSEGHIRVQQGINPALQERERDLQISFKAQSQRRIRLLTQTHTPQELAAADHDIEQVLAQYKELEGQIRTSSPGYAALTRPQPLTAAEIQQLLDPDTLLLEYSLGEERSYVFAVTPESLNVHELPKRAEIQSQAKHLYELLMARNRHVQGENAEVKQRRITQSDAEYLAAASRLSAVLFGPIVSDSRHKRLVIVGDGALQYFPFSALSEPQNLSYIGPPRTFKPLIAEREIVQLPSASVLAVLRRERKNRRPPSQQVVVIADPVFDARDIRVSRNASGRHPRITEEAKNVTLESDSARILTRSLDDVNLSRDGSLSLPRLLFTRREAAAIIALTPAGMGKEAVDFDANRRLAMSAELARYRVVHFATHALVDNVHPELSGLVLSLVDEKGKPQDGFLDLEDIYNLELGADLVVLSACDTALGKQVDGEGMVGLARGFMYAGASDVMGTLWKVEDFATSKFMKAFYTAMEQNRMPAAQALRQAQLALRKEKHWSAPYYWAAFTLQGDWR